MKFPNKPKCLVLINGCFDLLHAGHMNTLNKAKDLGDALWVGINSDAAIKKLKGPSRPIVDQTRRQYSIQSLAAVDHVFIFDDTDFAPYIAEIQPWLYVKGGDYSFEDLTDAEKMILKKFRIRFQSIQTDPELITSTTETVKQIIAAEVARGEHACKR